MSEERSNVPALTAGGAVRAIVPQDFDGAWRIALAVTKAGMSPRGLEEPEKAMVAIMHGLEVGLTPMAALQSIAVVNGRPTIWGDGAIGLVLASPKCEYVREKITGEGDAMVAICEAKRKGQEQPTVARFSVADAKKANLWGKKGPWQEYPKRMLAMRARAFALRDCFADVLKGLGIAEEVGDYNIIEHQAAAPKKAPPPPAVEKKAPPPADKKPDTAKPKDEPKPAETKAAVQDNITDIDPETGEVIEDSVGADDQGATTVAGTDDGTGQEESVGEFFERMDAAMKDATDEAGVIEVWNDFDALSKFEGDEDSQGLALSIKKQNLARVRGK